MTNLPLSRDYTLGPGDPVPSLLLDTLQDRDIAIHGLRPLYIGAADFADTGLGAGSAVFGSGAGLVAQWTLTGTRSVIANLILPVGVVIHDLTSRIKQTVANDSSSFVDECPYDGTNTVAMTIRVTGNQSATTGAWLVTSSIADPSFAIADAKTYYVVISNVTGTTNFNGVKLSISGP